MRLDISCSTDNNYLQHCMAMLCSVFENNTAHDITVHLLHNNLSDKSQHLLTELCSRYGQHVKFYDLSNNAMFDNLIITHSGLSIVTYYRLILGALIDESVKRLLYLDCDVIVLKDVSELFEMDMKDKGVAAVKDSCPLDNSHRLLLGIGLNDTLFCAGVLLINLDFWRKNNCQQTFFDFIDKTGDKLRFEDQDVLNYTFKNNWIQLAYKYGVSPLSIALLDNNQKSFDFFEYHFEPSIIHYAAHVKPWLNIRIPLDKYYWKYVNLSKFPNIIQTNAPKSVISKIKKAKLRYYLNLYVRPFIPDFVELIIRDIANLFKLVSCLFSRKKINSFTFGRWLQKYNLK